MTLNLIALIYELPASLVANEEIQECWVLQGLLLGYVTQSISKVQSDQATSSTPGLTIRWPSGTDSVSGVLDCPGEEILEVFLTRTLGLVQLFALQAPLQERG